MGSAMNLKNAALTRLPIDTPNYDRHSVSVGIAHIGVGHFHRAHQAMYIDQLLQQGLAQRVGHLRGRRDARRPQDGRRAARPGRALHTDPGESRRQPRRTSDRVDHRLPLRPRRPGVGHRAAGRAHHPDHLADHHRGRLPSTPTRPACSVWSPRRWPGGATAGSPSPTIVSCDNIEGNGEVARRGRSLANAERRDPGLAEWMAEHTRFPNSMVDRITPATTPEMAAQCGATSGSTTGGRCVAEPFTAWVLEDDFSDGRPPLEEVGVLLVDDVAPYELMKLRLLNAGHQCLCYFAYLGGYRVRSRRGA